MESLHVAITISKGACHVLEPVSRNDFDKLLAHRFTVILFSFFMFYRVTTSSIQSYPVFTLLPAVSKNFLNSFHFQNFIRIGKCIRLIPICSVILTICTFFVVVSLLYVSFLFFDIPLTGQLLSSIILQHVFKKNSKSLVATLLFSYCPFYQLMQNFVMVLKVAVLIFECIPLLSLFVK